MSTDDDRLRTALRHGADGSDRDGPDTDGADTDGAALLDRVHRGGRRRRARRIAGLTAVAAGSVAVAVVGWCLGD
ncbi:MAG: hypothetical protein M3Q87_11400, partial [Actinomycetota bacterium]|nr:hypothetical protein [Actinomycetota bacterium]